MAAPTRGDPFPGFDFVVEIDGVETAGFQEVSGLEGSLDVIEYREGADALTVRKLPGMVKYGNVTLKRGLTDSSSTPGGRPSPLVSPTAAAWRSSCSTGSGTRFVAGFSRRPGPFATPFLPSTPR